MLSLQGVMHLARQGHELPHEQYLPFPDGTEGILLDAAAALVADIASQPNEVRSTVAAQRLCNLSDVHGWFTVSSVLSMAFAHAYGAQDVPEMGQAGADLCHLLRVFAVVADHEEAEEGAWIAPLAQLASLGRGEALKFTGFGAIIALASITRSQVSGL